MPLCPTSFRSALRRAALEFPSAVQMADLAAEACGGDHSGAASRVMACAQMERRRHVDPATGAS
eukprot:7775808-Pyramimonas_sp.AAC.1